QSAGVPWYVFMSPLSALTDAMPGAGEVGMGRGIPLISSIMNELMMQFQPRNYREYNMKMSHHYQSVHRVAGQPDVPGDEKPGLMAAWPFWARFALNQGVLALVSLVVAVVAITPRKPWHAWRVKKRAAEA
ncbi:MAG: hypothetical protein MJA84_12765, partial [Firmicutes bacterium]|nr:hypothetical protein [Bacillota bacterium]